MQEHLGLLRSGCVKLKAAYCDVTPYGGYRDDEDQGQMGALGVLMAIGLFDGGW